jgi:hypothetical protein
MVGRMSVVKCPDIGPTTSTGGWPVTDALRKRRSVANGVAVTGSSVTATGRPPTTTASIPYSGRAWVGRALATTSQAARRCRTPAAPPSRGGSADSARAVNPDAASTGALARRLTSYAV